MQKYYYTDGTNTLGPFNLEELKEHRIAKETLVWFQELGQWQPAGSVAELSELFIQIAVPSQPVEFTAPPNVTQPPAFPPLPQYQAPPQYHQQHAHVNYQAVKVPSKPLVDPVALKEILVRFFNDPFHGIESLIKNPLTNTLNNTILLYGVVGVLYFAGGLINSGKFGLLYFVFPLLGMLLLALASFGVKSISSKPDFKTELFVSGLCGIPYMLLMILALMSTLFGASVHGPIGFKSVTMVLVIFSFFVLILINVLQQSFRASGLKEPLAWYLSPVIVFIVYFLSNEVYTFISKNILMNLFY